MKRILIVTLFSLLLIGLMITAASADVLFITNKFEFTLPDSWYYDESALTYARCKSSSGDTFQLLESDLDIPDTTEELVDCIANHFGAKEYVTGYEEVEIAGDKVMLVEMKANNKSGYMTMFKKSGRTISAFVISPSGLDIKSFIISALDSVQARQKKDIGFFNYGDAEVNLTHFSTKTVGKSKYLILDLTWRNVGDTASMFAVNVGVTVYQDGIQLHEGFLPTEQTETGTSIMPGKELAVKEIYELRSGSGKIDIIVDKLLDFTNEIVDRHYSFNLK